MLTSRAHTIIAAAVIAFSLWADVPAGGGETPAKLKSDLEGSATGCPLRFDANTICLPSTCLFVGRYNGSCGESAVAVFAGNGEHLVVGFSFAQTGTPTYLAGYVDSGTAATLAAWQPTLEEPASSMRPGSVTLERSGTLLRVRLRDAPFSIDGCKFGEFVGEFVEMVDAGEDVPDAGPIQGVSLTKPQVACATR